jgi:HAD superfamily hydrolase (TIGR01549 family)
MRKFVFLGTALITLSVVGITQKNATAKPRAIIFDIHGVLFEEDSVAFAKKIGLGAISSYTVSHWKNPVNTCLDTLEHMSKDKKHATSHKFTFKDRQMPHCIVEWQCGRKDYQEVHQELCSYWDCLHNEKYFKSTKEREITESVLRVALDPDTFTAVSKPMQSTLKLARELKHRGYKLYIAGNMPKEPYDIMLKANPEMKQLFDGIYVSSSLGMTKPNPQIFTHIAKAHKLNPKECLVIDDEMVNVKAAQEVGMQGLLFTSAKQIEKMLKRQGVM